MRKNAKTIRLSIIMPIYNEAATVEQAIRRVLARKEAVEVIVVNDGSTDETGRILQRLSKTLNNLKLLIHQRNQGKGAAIRTGLTAVTGNYVLIHDADLEYDPSDIKALLAPIREGKATVVFGSRFRGSHSNMFFWHYLGNSLLNLLINVFYDTTLSDMETCYKLIPTDLVRSFSLKERGFGIEPELTSKILKKGYLIYEVPISYAGRTYAEGKKLNWTEGIRALGIILRERLTG
ncbi:glycosyl transferase [Microgenomates group bacterium RIFCSPLOWO2_01_FULL_46_13]|nr:MAG: glycosyl transferase [Microgenomates group bacterium RIFCSPHIGHO2_01_FULL_45_11]OGV94493.1 MAG: glycosyl transferase [Microgenomates group bacterium RIFCSPLOWO2_01_FULL_46_13]